MPVLVDSNVLLDVLAIHPIVYAEVSIGFVRIEEIDAALPLSTFHRLALPWEAAFLAGKCFLAYRKRRGVRASPLPDFYIGHEPWAAQTITSAACSGVSTSVLTTRS